MVQWNRLVYHTFISSFSVHNTEYHELVCVVILELRRYLCDYIAYWPLILTEAIRTTVVPIRILIRTTVVPIDSYRHDRCADKNPYRHDKNKIFF